MKVEEMNKAELKENLNKLEQELARLNETEREIEKHRLNETEREALYQWLAEKIINKTNLSFIEVTRIMLEKQIIRKDWVENNDVVIVSGGWTKQKLMEVTHLTETSISSVIHRLKHDNRYIIKNIHGKYYLFDNQQARDREIDNITKNIKRIAEDLGVTLWWNHV
jgi:hypothetical protein